LFEVYAPHVLGWLDRRDKFEGYVCNAYHANDAPEYLVQGVIVQEDRSDEDVDWGKLVLPFEVGDLRRTDSSADEGEEE
jgi:hypothetical protein